MTVYSLPDRVWTDWDGSKRPDFKPNARQAMVMQAVERALDDGVFYQNDLVERIASEFGISDEVRDRNKAKAEHGDFGSDLYLARQAVEARRDRENEAKLGSALGSLKAGDKLGAMMFSDGKLVRAVTVTGVDGDSIAFIGKRGRVEVAGKVTPSQLKRAMDRAKERGGRADDFDAFAAGRAKAVEMPAAPNVSNPTPAIDAPSERVEQAPADDRQNDTAAKPKPHAELEGKTIEQEMEVEGHKVVRRRDAAKALRALDEREASLRALLECLKGGG